MCHQHQQRHADSGHGRPQAHGDFHYSCVPTLLVEAEPREQPFLRPHLSTSCSLPLDGWGQGSQGTCVPHHARLSMVGTPRPSLVAHRETWEQWNISGMCPSGAAFLDLSSEAPYEASGMESCHGHSSSVLLLLIIGFAEDFILSQQPQPLSSQQEMLDRAWRSLLPSS